MTSTPSKIQATVPPAAVPVRCMRCHRPLRRPDAVRAELGWRCRQAQAVAG